MKKLVDNLTGKNIKPDTFVSYEIKDGKLIFNFEAYDSSLNSYSNIDNDKLYNGDVVEVFLDVGDEFYYEFEVYCLPYAFPVILNNFAPRRRG